MSASDRREVRGAEVNDRKRPASAYGIWAMPSARALLVASLLTEPPYGCLGPSGNDRYRKRSQTVCASQTNCHVAAVFFPMNRPPADVFLQALLEDPPQ